MDGGQEEEEDAGDADMRGHIPRPPWADHARKAWLSTVEA